MRLLAAEVVDAVSRGQLPGLWREASCPLRQVQRVTGQVWTATLRPSGIALEGHWLHDGTKVRGLKQRGWRRCCRFDKCELASRQVPRRQTGSHRPVPSDCNVGGMRVQGNGNLSARQAAAVRRIVMHAMMAAVVVPSAAHTVSGPSHALRAAIQSPHQFENSVPDHASFDVCWDAGASLTVTPDKRDFVDQVRRPSIAVHLKGVARGLHTAGEGHVMWSFLDRTGQLRHVRLPAFHAPRIPLRLLSVVSALQMHEGEHFVVAGTECELSSVVGVPDRNPIDVRVGPINNLPMPVRCRTADLPVDS
jgi:hypothetical protein